MRKMNVQLATKKKSKNNKINKGFVFGYIIFASFPKKRAKSRIFFALES